MTDQAGKLRDLVEEMAEEAAAENEIGGVNFEIGDTTRVITVTSGKGGVGKTNFAVNLAVALQTAGNRVLLIDADVGMANVNVLMGHVTNKSLLDLLDEDTELESVVEEGVAGVKYISGVAGIEEVLGVNRYDRRRIHRKLERCSEIADIVIIDTGAGLSRYVIEFVLAAQEVLLITTPEPTALADAYAVVKAYGKYTDKRSIKLIVNRIRDEEESKEVTDRLNQTTQKFLNMSIECLGYIYEDRAVQKAVQNQEPFVLMSPESPAARCVKELAKALITGEKQAKVSKGWRNFLERLLD